MSNVYETPEWAAWLASIKEMPDDDNRRLVAADFLEERGEVERSEFIRVCCGHRERGDDPITRILGGMAQWATCGITPDWSWSGGGTADPYPDPVVVLMPSGARFHYYRGFVSRVSGPLVSLIGGDCGRCGLIPGTECTTHVVHNDSEDPADWSLEKCPHCNGTGRTPGVLRDLVRREPVATVEVTDREPDPIGDRWCWIRIRDGLADTGACLPAEIFDLLEGERERAGEDWAEMIGHHDEWVMYPTPDAARAALSAALLRLVQPVEVPT